MRRRSLARTTTPVVSYNDTTGSASTPALGWIPVRRRLWSRARTGRTPWLSLLRRTAMHFPVILTGPSSSTTLGADAQAALTALEREAGHRHRWSARTAELGRSTDCGVERWHLGPAHCGYGRYGHCGADCELRLTELVLPVSAGLLLRATTRFSRATLTTGATRWALLHWVAEPTASTFGKEPIMLVESPTDCRYVHDG